MIYQSYQLINRDFGSRKEIIKNIDNRNINDQKKEKKLIFIKD